MWVHYTLQGTEAKFQREPTFTGEPVNSSHTKNRNELIVMVFKVSVNVCDHDNPFV